MSSIEYKLEKMAYANTSRQMDWQERMSNTSHQREVADLKSAGLNPVLSANAGAQAYTTSVDSAVNALGNLAATREAAAAQRYAARQSAAATRYAANASIQATKLQGSANITSQIVSGIESRKTQRAQAQNEINVRNSVPASSIAGLIDKYTTNLGLVNQVQTSRAMKTVKTSVGRLLNSEILWNTDAKGQAKSLSKAGVKYVNNLLDKLGIVKTAYTRLLFLNAYVYGKAPAIRAIAKLIDNKNSNVRSSRLR